jgi:hypothetical protein
MKMEHTITAPAAGTVKGFHFAVGDQVGDGMELVDFEPTPAPRFPGSRNPHRRAGAPRQCRRRHGR